MGKLYIFFIGGTGSRVLRSLLHILASGVSFKVSSIIPIIIDPDSNNGDLTRSINSLKKYKELHKDIGNFNSSSFFKTNIETISDLNINPDLQSVDEFRFKLVGTQNERFEEFINCSSLSDANNDFSKALFSEKNLNSTMDVGFKGNPNIGTVVLNQIVESNSFQIFQDNFQENDSVFIVSSIFGGTGAAGFPILIKNLRNSQNSFIKNAKIGAITILPYFTLNSENEDISSIDSDAFILKSKAALSYYRKNISNLDDSSINAHYYIGFNHPNNLKNEEGGPMQKNKANFVELASALSIQHFSKNVGQFETKEGRASNPKFYEYGTKGDYYNLNLFNLNSQFEIVAASEFSKFTFLGYLLKHLLVEQSKIETLTWANNGGLKLNSDFFNSPFIMRWKEYNNDYFSWLQEMDGNGVTFKPFNLEVEEINIFNFINGIEQKKPKGILNKLGFGGSNIDFINNEFNKAEKKIGERENVNVKFTDVSNIGITNILNSRYNYNFRN